MPTLYVENVPEDLYQALRARAKSKGNSISAEVIQLLRDTVPTAAELKRRQDFARFSDRMRRQQPAAPGPFPSAEEMLREDRGR